MDMDKCLGVLPSMPNMPTWIGWQCGDGCVPKERDISPPPTKKIPDMRHHTSYMNTPLRKMVMGQLGFLLLVYCGRKWGFYVCVNIFGFVVFLFFVVVVICCF